MLASSYALIYYTDFTEIIADYEDYRYNVGWIVIGLILFAIVWNVAKILIKTIISIKRKIMNKYPQKMKKSHQ